MEVVIADKTKRRFVEALITKLEESKELKEFMENLSEAEADTLYERIVESVDDFFNDLTFSIEY